MSCPKCGCNFEIEWWDSKCPQCGLGYKTDTCGELWSDDEYAFVTEWESFAPLDPFDCGVGAYYAQSDKGFDMACPWDDGTKESVAWNRGWSQAKDDCE